MRSIKVLLSIMLLLAHIGCDDEEEALDFDFEIPRAVAFSDSIRDYQLFAEPLADLRPQSSAVLYELSSELFTDYAGKQRLLRLPEDAQASVLDGRVIYPEGTLLAKTFYFDADLNDPTRGRKIVETRLLIKREGQWNVATYQWNDEQSDAYLTLEGSAVEVSFVDKAQNPRQTAHQIPREVACVTCHQDAAQSVYIGPSLKNLDREVERGGVMMNQLDYLASLGLFPANLRSLTPMVNYTNESQPLDRRARAYLDINCAHCHNPKGWSRPAEEGLDLHYEVPFTNTGISNELRALRRNVQSGEMPFLGTTLKHSEGVELLLSYFDSL